MVGYSSSEPKGRSWISLEQVDDIKPIVSTVGGTIENERKYIKSMNEYLGDVSSLEPERIIEKIKHWRSSLSTDTKVNIKVIRLDEAVRKMDGLLEGSFCNNRDADVFRRLRELVKQARNTWNDLGPFEETLIWASGEHMIKCRAIVKKQIQKLEGQFSKEDLAAIRSVTTPEWFSKRVLEVWHSQVLFKFKVKTYEFPEALYAYIINLANESELHFIDKEQYIPEDTLVQLYYREAIDPCSKYHERLKRDMEDLNESELFLKPKNYDNDLEESVRRYVICKNILSVSRENCYYGFRKMVEDKTGKPIRQNFFQMFAGLTKSLFNKKANVA